MHKARWMRRGLGLLLGAVAATAVMRCFELVAQWLYPLPDAWETASRADLASVMGDMPAAARILVACGWFAGAFCGAWLALRVSDWRWSAWIVAGLLVAGGIANLVAIPHPVWMQVAAIVAPVAGGWLARRAHRKPYRGEPLLG